MGIILKKDIKAYQAGGLVTSFKVEAPIEKIPVFKVPYDFSGAKTTKPFTYKPYVNFKEGIASQVSYHNTLMNEQANTYKAIMSENDPGSDKYNAAMKAFVHLKDDTGSVQSTLNNDLIIWNKVKDKDLTDSDIMITDDNNIVGYVKSDYNDKVIVSAIKVPFRKRALSTHDDSNNEFIYAKFDDDGKVEYLDPKKIDPNDNKNIKKVYISSARYVKNEVLTKNKYMTDDTTTSLFLNSINNILNTAENLKSVSQFSNNLDINSTLLNLTSINKEGKINQISVNITNSHGTLKENILNNPVSQVSVRNIDYGAQNILSKNHRFVVLKYIDKYTMGTNIGFLNFMKDVITGSDGTYKSFGNKMLYVSMNNAKQDSEYKGSDVYWKNNYKQNMPVDDHTDFLINYLTLVRNEAEILYDSIHENNNDGNPEDKKTFVNTVLYNVAEKRFNDELENFKKQKTITVKDKKTGKTITKTKADGEIADDDGEKLKDYINLITDTKKTVTLKTLINNIQDKVQLDLTNIQKNTNNAKPKDDIKGAFTAMADSYYDDSKADQYLLSFNNRYKNKEYKENLYSDAVSRLFVQKTTNYLLSLEKDSINATTKALMGKENQPNTGHEINKTNYDSSSGEVNGFNYFALIGNLKPIIFLPTWSWVINQDSNINGSKVVTFTNNNGAVSSQYFSHLYNNGEEISTINNDRIINFDTKNNTVKAAIVPSFFSPLNIKQKVLYSSVTKAFNEIVIGGVEAKIPGRSFLNENTSKLLKKGKDTVTSGSEVDEILAPFVYAGYMSVNYGMDDGNLLFGKDKNGKPYLKNSTNINIDNGSIEVLFSQFTYNNDNDTLTVKINGKQIPITSPVTKALYKAHELMSNYIDNATKNKKKTEDDVIKDFIGNKTSSYVKKVIDDMFTSNDTILSGGTNNSIEIGINDVLINNESDWDKIKDAMGIKEDLEFHPKKSNYSKNEDNFIKFFIVPDVNYTPAYLEDAIYINKAKDVQGLYDGIIAKNTDKDLAEKLGFDLNDISNFEDPKTYPNDFVEKLNVYYNHKGYDKNDNTDKKVLTIYNSLHPNNNKSFNNNMALWVDIYLNKTKILKTPTSPANINISVAKAVNKGNNTSNNTKGTTVVRYYIADNISNYINNEAFN